MNSTYTCPCQQFEHPGVIFNAPGLSTIHYRVGDYAAFREALLRPLDGEVELSAWRPGAQQDLAVQIVEWWAYLSDILTFYDERVANEAFLRTAFLEESTRHIVRLLGYRPRPGIGATGTVAALVKGPKPIVIPAGYQIQSKPGPGQTPQTFEVDVETTAALPDEADADPAASNAVSNSLLLAGQSATAAVGETLLVVNRGWAAQSTDFASFVTVVSLVEEQDPRGKKNMRLTFSPALSSAPAPASLRLLRSSDSVGLWGYSGTIVDATTMHLASLVRQIEVGDIVVVDKGGTSPTRTPVSVTSNSEKVWFANSTNPDVSPDPDTTVPIPILHTILGYTGTLDTAAIIADSTKTRVRYRYQDVGTVIATPASTVAGPDLALSAAGNETFPSLAPGDAVLVQDGVGDGTKAAVVSASAASLELTAEAAGTLQAPVSVLFNLLPVSRGKSVANEVLGSGDATAAGQEFVLKKSPLTYLPSTDPETPESYKSTLRVYVDGIAWKEAASFYGQGKDARVFVTKEDDEQKTHVLFGDGVDGARLPSGTNNVTAYYRYESGAALPDTGKLTVMLQPLPGLKGIVNPVQPFGGEDPDSAERLRVLAPKSVLTFNRAVSGADYEAIASATPGVARAKAYWSFNTERQQTVVTVYVGDTAGAMTAAKQALARTADPNRPLEVLQALALPVRLRVTVRLSSGFLEADVAPAVQAALVDPDKGLLGTNVVRIGQTLFRSQIYQACLSVAGVAAVESFTLRIAGRRAASAYRYYAGEGRFFQLDPENLTVIVEAANG
jgi:predicted phage baseplate assembly protein